MNDVSSLQRTVVDIEACCCCYSSVSNWNIVCVFRHVIHICWKKLILWRRCKDELQG